MLVLFALVALFWCIQGTNSLTLTACDNGFGQINCNSDLITISSVTFNEVSDCSSNVAVVPPCSSSTAVDVVKTACEYRSYCQLRASEVSFGTTCSGKMLLSVTYSCVSGLLGDRYPAPGAVTKSSVQIAWQKHSGENDDTKYVVEKRYVPASQPSAIAGLSFEGFGYIKFFTDPFDGGKAFITKLSFRTFAPNCLLFVAFKSDKNDWVSYAYLQLASGKLKFGVKGDKRSLDVTTTVTLNDGQFHTVQAEKKQKKGENKDSITLTVDAEIATVENSKGKEIDVSVENVYVGGITSDHVVGASGVLSHTEPFIGCMQIDQLEDNKPLELSKNQSYENVRWSSSGCPSAVNKGMHFRGAGYAKLTLSSSSSSSQLQISFRLRTSWPNGLLLAAYSDDKSISLFIETRVDGLDLRYKKGDQSADGPFLVRVQPNDASLCDGAWHTVNFTIDTSFLVVSVDGVSHSTSSEITDVLTYSSKILENFYLGGMEHKGASPTMDEIALGYGVNVTSYGGCLADLEVNGQLVDVPNVRNASLNVSFAGCPDFTWNGPTCQDQTVHVGTKSKGVETLTDTSGVEAFSEYLYRVSVESGSGALVPSTWIVVRSGEDASSKGPLPELEYDGTNGKGTFRWTGPPAIVKTDSSYDIEYSKIYPGTAVQSSALTFITIHPASLPHISDVAALTAYTFSITATLVQGSVTVTSGYANVTTKGRECVRSFYNGTYYRGTTAVSADGRSCLNWSELSTYSNLVALYPEAGLGNHSYCRNPISESRTKPWCYTNDTGGCLNWTYCDIDVCEDTPMVLADFPSVTYVCEGNSGADQTKCIFPFIYNGTRFFECTLFEKGIPWCSTKNDGNGNMEMWSYCLCPKPSNSVPQPSFTSPPAGKRIDGTCPSVTTTEPPTTLPPTPSASTSAPTAASTTAAVTTMSSTTASATTTAATTSSPPTAATTSSPPTAAAATAAATTAAATTASPTTSAASAVFSNTAATMKVSSTSASSTTSSAATSSVPTTPTKMPLSTVRSETTAPTTGSSNASAPTQSNTTSAATTNSSAATTVSSTAATVPMSTTTAASTAVSSSSSPSTEIPSKAPTSSSSSPSPSTNSPSRTPTHRTSGAPSTPFPRTTIPTDEKSSQPPLHTSETSRNSQSTATASPTSPQVSSAASLASTPTPTPAKAANSGSSSFVFIGAGVGGGLVAIAVAIVVAVFLCRRGSKSKSVEDTVKEEAIELFRRNSAMHPTGDGVASPFSDADFMSDDYHDTSKFHTMSKPGSGFFSPVITEPKIAEIHTNQDDSQYEAPVVVTQVQPRPLPEPPKATNNEDIYWEPAKREETLYEQLSGGKFRVLERSSIELQEVLGTGQFGTVEKGIWTPALSSPVVVAVKSLKSESNENKVHFLREAAIMGQFHHRNVVVMHGVVLTGKPLMVVLEILPKGDLKQYLQSIASKDTFPLNLPTQFLQMARDIAAGMEYLAKRCFIHRDLAARNILLDEKLVCKISDFGLSRDLADDSYYVTQGGQVPIRWTAPEAISYKKYSSESDVWSYGIVLYEIWTVGKRPYGPMKNSVVVDLLETGHRLPPPPGCSYEIYKLMIECWDPEHRQRPSFNAIATHLSQPDDVLLVNGKNTEPISGKVGDKLELSPSQSAYQTLQTAYQDLNDYAFIN